MGVVVLFQQLFIGLVYAVAVTVVLYIIRFIARLLTLLSSSSFVLVQVPFSRWRAAILPLLDDFMYAHDDDCSSPRLLFID